jgi:CBS domain containing-hemolysin-like protein
MIWVWILFCLAGSSLFSGVEAGIFSVNRVRLRHQIKLGDGAARRLDGLLQRPDRVLVTVLVVTNLLNIFALALATQAAGEWLGPWWGNGLVLLVGVPVYVLGVELVPKAVFRRIPHRALAALAEPLRLVDRVLSPMHWLGQRVAGWVAGKQEGRADRPERKLFVGREEFKYLTIESERTGSLGQMERRMIHNVVDFRGVRASEVMVPIEAVQCIGAGDSVGTLIERSRAQRIERWPVLGEEGEFVGLVNVLDVALSGRHRGRVEAFQRRIVKVGPGDSAHSVLRRLRAARSTMAAVVGPGGRPLGVVTWEGLIQKLMAAALVEPVRGDVSSAGAGQG